MIRMKTYVVSEEHETFDVILGMKELVGSYLKLWIYSFGTAKLKQAVKQRYLSGTRKRRVRVADGRFVWFQGSLSSCIAGR